MISRAAAGLTVAVACIGIFVTVLDANVVTVALPTIGARLGGDVSGLQWVVDAYTLMFAALLLCAGAISDRVGASRAFALGLGVFTAASAVCGLAPNLGVLIGARVVQGAAAAVLLPASLSLVRQAFPEAAARARAVALWTAGGGVAMAAAPVVGGVLTQLLGWRAVFFVNVPVGVLGLVGLLRAPRSAPRPAGLDLAGQLLCVLGITAVVFAVIDAGDSGFGWTSGLNLAGFGLAVVAFLIVENRSPHPAVPLELFRSSTVTVCTVTGFALGFAFYGNLFVLTLFFQHLRGASALATGLIFVPMTALTAVFNIVAGKLVGHFGPRVPMVAGLLILAMGMIGLLLIGPGTPTLLIAALLIPVGAGGALATPAMTTALLDAVEPRRSGLASGLLNAARQLGGAIGVAVCGALVSGSASGPEFMFGMRTSLVTGGAILLIAAVAGLVVRLQATADSSPEQPSRPVGCTGCSTTDRSVSASASRCDRSSPHRRHVSESNNSNKRTAEVSH